jgi:zinc transport system ATP-binding protein
MEKPRPQVHLEHVSVTLQDLLVLEDVSLSVRRGEFLAVIGPNGAGKTTLLKVILGLVRPTAGQAHVFGRRPWERDGLPGRIGYVPQVQSVDLNFPVRVDEVVMMGRYGRIGVFHRASRADVVSAHRAMERVAIADLAARPIGRLSGGQRQRAFLARALANEPDLLLLDEPTTGVDPGSGESLYALLAELHGEGMTMIVVSHDVGVVASYVDGVACVNRRLVAHGRPEEVLGSEELAQMYGCMAMLFHHGRAPHVVVGKDR